MRIDVWSDVACPFCYIGITQLEKALKETDTEAEIIFHSFQLDPTTPKKTTKTLNDVLAEKYGMTPAQAWDANAEAASMALKEGLEFHMNKAVPVNTFDAHRLIHLAVDEGKQREMKLRLLRAYFTEGKSVADHATLAELALEVGIDEGRAKKMLKGNDYADAVKADIELATSLGARGVPFFVVDRTHGFSGAQGVDGFKTILESISSEK